MDGQKVTFEKGYTQRSYSLWLNGYRFVRNKTVPTLTGNSKYWDCEQKCEVKAITRDECLDGILSLKNCDGRKQSWGGHNHAPNTKKYEAAKLQNFRN